ncbi:hypothetical protein KPL74_15520 [Bacillus sp. NP157]|nr:hypothetical protein KPL74_15520 [Bacillus sp. NP157]
MRFPATLTLAVTGFITASPVHSAELADAHAALAASTADGRGETSVTLPLRGGAASTFRMVDSGVLPRALVRRHPSMRSYRGEDAQGRTARLDYAGNVGRLSVSGDDDDTRPWEHVETLPSLPMDLLPTNPRASQAAAGLHGPAPDGRGGGSPTSIAQTPFGGDLGKAGASHGNVRYDFRLALAADSRFVAANGGTVASALGAAAHMVNRANERMENDLGVHLVLAAQSDRLMMASAASDPLRHGEPRTAAAMLIQRRLAASSYDIGHALLGLNGGETATGTSCSDARDADYLATHKAAAWSGGEDDDAALEAFILVLGNQLGAPFRKPRCPSCHAFDGASIERVRVSLGSRGGRCARKHVSDATAAWIDPESLAEPIVIPAHTPFWLDATIEPTMPGRRLSFAWDELGESPRSERVAPSRRSRREFVDDLPDAAGSRYFRLTVRDQGGLTATVASEDTRVQVVDTGGAFALHPTADARRGEALDVRWDVAGTTTRPISCHFLDLGLSIDDGASWTTLARDVPNSGSAAINLPPDAATDKARLRIACDWRPFFAVSPKPFRIL